MSPGTDVFGFNQSKRAICSSVFGSSDGPAVADEWTAADESTAGDAANGGESGDAPFDAAVGALLLALDDVLDEATTGWVGASSVDVELMNCLSGRLAAREPTKTHRWPPRNGRLAPPRAAPGAPRPRGGGVSRQKSSAARPLRESPAQNGRSANIYFSICFALPWDRKSRTIVLAKIASFIKETLMRLFFL